MQGGTSACEAGGGCGGGRLDGAIDERFRGGAETLETNAHAARLVVSWLHVADDFGLGPDGLLPVLELHVEDDGCLHRKRWLIDEQHRLRIDAEALAREVFFLVRVRAQNMNHDRARQRDLQRGRGRANSES